MLRQDINEALKTAMKAKNARATSTLRLILAALKDRDIAARGRGVEGGVSDDDILAMLQTMIRQRRESMAQYEQGGRLDLVKQEAEEIAIIEGFLPRQLSDAEVATLVAEAIAEVGAANIKDMGRVMAALKAKHAGRMDFAKVSAVVRQLLGAS